MGASSERFRWTRPICLPGWWTATARRSRSTSLPMEARSLPAYCSTAGRRTMQHPMHPPARVNRHPLRGLHPRPPHLHPMYPHPMHPCPMHFRPLRLPPLILHRPNLHRRHLHRQRHRGARHPVTPPVTANPSQPPGRKATPTPGSPWTGTSRERRPPSSSTWTNSPASGKAKARRAIRSISFSTHAAPIVGQPTTAPGHMSGRAPRSSGFPLPCWAGANPRRMANIWTRKG